MHDVYIKTVFGGYCLLACVHFNLEMLCMMYILKQFLGAIAYWHVFTSILYTDAGAL